MKNKVEAATAKMGEVLDLLDVAAKGYPIKALAPMLKTELTPEKAESTLRAELNQTFGAKLGLVTSVQIMAETGSLAALDRIEAMFNRTAFELPHVTAGDPAPFMKLLSKLSKEFSETVQEVSSGLANDDLDAAETCRCIKEVDDLIESAIRFKATLLHHQKSIQSK